MKFTKMHGLGNDYVFVDARGAAVANPRRLAVAISDRHGGVGSDGLILMESTESADVRMVMYNADGSRAEMCGNGIRCVAKYAVEHGFTKGPAVMIETDAGLRRAECLPRGGLMEAVRVDMGRPLFAASDLPATFNAGSVIDHPLEVDGSLHRITCVSMGNPHCVEFVESLSEVALDILGPRLECAPEFPNRINVHFAQVDARDHVVAKSWERGSGATRACGTGACAVCVAGALTGRTERAVRVSLPGGDLEIEWGEDDHVYMTGPAEEVFNGDWPDP